MDESTNLGLPPVDSERLTELKRRARDLLLAIGKAEAEVPDRAMSHHRKVASLWAQFHSVAAVAVILEGNDAYRLTEAHHEYLKQVARMVNADKQDLMPEVLRRIEQLEGKGSRLQAIP